MGESSKQNFPDLFGFGIIDKGDIWNRPMATSSFALVKVLGANTSSTRGVLWKGAE